jgi:hypothetical protein
MTEKLPKKIKTFPKVTDNPLIAQRNKEKKKDFAVTLGNFIGVIAGYFLVSLFIYAIVVLAIGIKVTFWQVWGSLMILVVVKNVFKYKGEGG